MKTEEINDYIEKRIDDVYRRAYRKGFNDAIEKVYKDSEKFLRKMLLPDDEETNAYILEDEDVSDKNNT